MTYSKGAEQTGRKTIITRFDGDVESIHLGVRGAPLPITLRNSLSEGIISLKDETHALLLDLSSSGKSFKK